MGVGVGACVGVGRGVGVFVVVAVGRSVGVGEKSVGEDVAVGVASGGAESVGDVVAARVAVTASVGRGVCRRCPPAPRVG